MHANTPSLRPRGRPRREEQAAALVAAAADIVVKGGYEGLSLDDLIAQVGGSRRAIYSHFGNKEGLFIEAVSRLCDELAAPLRALQIEDSEAGVEEALCGFAEAHLQIVLHPRAVAIHRLMIGQGTRFPERASAIWRAGHQNCCDLLAGWIGRQQAIGTIRAGSPDLLAAQFVDLLSGNAQLRALVGLAPLASLAIIAREAMQTFLHGCRADPPNSKAKDDDR